MAFSYPRADSVIIAPLNWGLGHATRCMPIIDYYLAQGAEVHLASDSEARMLLQAEYPKLTVHELPAYGIRYSKRAATLPLMLMSQLPKLLKAIRAEHLAFDALVSRLNPQLIISDNRYGCYNDAIESIFIGHQLRLSIPVLGSSVNKEHKSWIERFDAVWVPDHADQRLSGKLSDGKLLIPIEFIGPLSRLKPKPQAEKNISVLAILSGPEPQRSALEAELIPILEKVKGSVLIQGRMETREERQQGDLTILTHALTADLQELMSASQWVICRSGYSSIMDLDAMGAKAILIPTPGQPEQEYLATRLGKSVSNHFERLSQNEIQKQLAMIIEEWGR